MMYGACMHAAGTPNPADPVNRRASHSPGLCPPPKQNGTLAEREGALAANISALFSTAKLELARKDGEIKELRQQ